MSTMVDENSNGKNVYEDIDNVLKECEYIINIHVRGDLIKSMKLVEEKSNQHFIFRFFHVVFVTQNAMITADTEMMKEALKLVRKF